MKTKEFIREVEYLGFAVVKGTYYVQIQNPQQQTVLTVDVQKECIIHYSWKDFFEIGDETKRKLFSLASEYAATPIDEREEEELYYLELPLDNSGGNFINLHESGNKIIILTREEGLGYRTKFTLKEINGNPKLKPFEQFKKKVEQ